MRFSLPESRSGSLWQQHRSFTSWWQTNASVLRSPRKLFESIRIEPRTGTGLMIVNCWLAGAVLVAPWTGTLVGDPARAARLSGLSSPARELLTFTFVFPLQALVVGAVLFLLTYLEYIGIRFIAGRRSWRLTRMGAWQVCSHASVGWLVLAVMPLLALAFTYILHYLFPGILGYVADLRNWGMSRFSIGSIVSGMLPLLGLLFGLLIFEYLVHLGVRANRYAAVTTVPKKRISNN